MTRNEALLLASWNPKGVRGRMLELDHLLKQHGIDICLLTDTHLRSDEAFRRANYVCHHTDLITEGGETAILFRRGIFHYAVPVQGL
jgi:exonuclease III